jgi:hypothetical protein
VDYARPWRRIAVAVASIALFVAMTVFASKNFSQGCEEEDAVPGMLSAYHAGQGFIGTNEYEPIGADNSLVATSLPLACLVSDPATELGRKTDSEDDEDLLAWDATQHSCEATFGAAAKPGAEHLRIHAVTDSAGYLVLRLRSFPAWRVRVNGSAVTSLPRREDGLMAVPVPQGPVELAVDWTTTTDVLAGRWLSVLALLALTGVFLLERKRA